MIKELKLGLSDANKAAMANDVYNRAVATIDQQRAKIVIISDASTTLGTIATQLNTINTNGEHVFFDVSALGASMYLCTIFIDTNENVYKIFDLVNQKLTQGTYDSTKLLTMAIANSDTIAGQTQIDSLQKQVDELGGKSSVEDLETLGDQIEAGTSVNFISAGDTIDFNWINTVLGTIVSGATVTCSDVDAFATKMGEAEAKTYYFVYNGSNWTYNETVVDLSDYALTVSGTPVTGDVMSIVTTVTTVSYTFTGYDDVTLENGDTATHTWLMEQTYAPATKAFDSLEALILLADGNTIPAGNYYVTANYQNGGTPYTLYFTVATAITASGADIQLAATGINWTSPYYPTNLRPYVYGTNTTAGDAMSLSTTEISGATDISTLTGVSIHDSLIQCDLGNNNWERSNMRAWLNDATNGSGYVPSYSFDRPSSYNLSKGFLYGLDPRVKRLIHPVVNSFTAGYDNDGYTQDTTYTCVDSVFLLSMKEMGFNINTAEGNVTDLYNEYLTDAEYTGVTNDAIADRSKYNQAGGTKNSYRWSRSAVTWNANVSWYVAAAGGGYSDGAVGGFYFAPAFAIGKAIE